MVYVVAVKFPIEDLLGSKACIKILKTLIKEEYLNITSIITKSTLNHRSTLKYLSFLKICNLIQEKKYGRIKMYRYNTTNFKASILKKLIEIWENID